MDKVTKHLAKQARAARLAKGMTQEDLAGRIEMATESVSHIERGVTVPSLKTLAAMADVLEISVADFFAGLTDHRALSGSRMEQKPDCAHWANNWTTSGSPSSSTWQPR
jgi:transcriptional regulator with XRE-family HTH domain